MADDNFLEVTSFDPLMISAPAGPQGIQGPTGETGPQGPQGPPGPSGDGGVNAITAADSTITVDATDPTTPTIKVTAGHFDAAGAAATAQTNAEAHADSVAATAQSTAETYADTNKLAKSQNLADLTDASAARLNLYLGDIAIQNGSSYLAVSNCLGELPLPNGPSIARGHLGLGTAATANVMDSIADGDTANPPSRNAVHDALLAYAQLNSPLFTGFPSTTSTPSPNDNSTKLATTAYADAKVENAITAGHTAIAPSGDSVNTALAAKAPLASPALTGNPTAPTQTAGNNSTKIATTAYVDNRPIFRGFPSAATTTTTGVLTSIAMDTESVDSHNGHDAVTNPSRYTAQVAGWYRVIATATFNPNVTGRRIVEILVVGSIANTTEVAGSAGSATRLQIQCADLVFMNVGDYVEFATFQDSGGNLSVSGGTLRTSMSVIFEHA